MNEIAFLNIDLDIESDEDLSPLVSEMSATVSVMRNEWIDSSYCASFETGAAGENGITKEYVSLIEGLTAEGQRLWQGCSKREFDIGYESGETPNDFHSILSAESIFSLAKLGSSVAITIYPIRKANTN